ncbi:Poly [ADP-ribose] polymerase 2 [Fusarium oxysporum f. sp. cubense race 1]|uniref:NAD(+) ADP-ribosyltransferase n=1 Tax=Fusarium oxysporum f. sp. cubense (strain race 1) TaxID=1229664 RepID=N4U7Y6_FUSC1|nr:Poly [ADP-ribose] polymerase 2 [Fusarium oxysporum f. sp. cubense race 1]
MPPRNKGVANPFAGYVITVCGRPGTIDGKPYTHDRFKDIIVQYGGRFVRSVTGATTHVVATKDSLERKTATMVAARDGNLSFMKPEWLIDTDTKKKKLNAKKYAWTDLEKLRVSQVKTQSAKTKTTKKIAKAKARVKDEPKEDGEAPPKTSAKPTTAAKPKPKAAAKPTTAAKPKPKAAAKSKASKPKPKAAAKSKASKPKPKAAAKSKASKPKAAAQSKTKAKSKTSVEPLTEYDVWVDDSGLIYDAYLTQTSSGTNRDRHYRIQVRKDPESSTFKTRTEWAGIGKTPMYQVLGNGGLEDAVKEFEKKFKSKSDLAWENRFAHPVPDKYKYVHHSGGDNDTTDHS